MPRLLPLASPLFCGALLVACGAGDDQAPAGAWVIDPDGGFPTNDAPTGSWDGGEASVTTCQADTAAPESICDCTLDGATDFTASPEVTVPFTNKYEPRCIRVATGTTVTWTGNFEAHPLWPSACSGDVDANPIHDVTDIAASSLDIAFTEPGTFPYYCPYHANDGPSPSGMCGVVYVVP